MSSASHRVVLHLLSSGNSQRSASPPTHKATAVNRKEPAKNPCKLFSFAHSSLYPGDIKVYSEDDEIKIMVNLRSFKTIASPCLPPSGNTGRPGGESTTSSTNFCQLLRLPGLPTLFYRIAQFVLLDCPHCFTGLPKLFYRIAQLVIQGKPGYNQIPFSASVLPFQLSYTPSQTYHPF